MMRKRRTTLAESIGDSVETPSKDRSMETDYRRPYLSPSMCHPRARDAAILPYGK